MPNPVISGYIGDENYAEDAQGTQQDLSNVSSADNGFRPEEDGFSFENYGSELKVVDLTSAEMTRMFGSRVQTDDQGTLLPNARRWMEEENGEMAGGHCEGMAVLSLLIYYGLADPAKFGGSTTSSLDISQPELQKEIAYWWATQATSPAYNYRVNGPVETLRTLSKTFQEGKNANETWTMAVRKEDGSDGHAVTPFAVEEKGDGIYDILVYDNNFPGQTRVVEVNSNDDTFSYESATNPDESSSLYTGHNLLLKGTNARLKQQDCDFCQEEGSGSEVNATDVGFDLINASGLNGKLNSNSTSQPDKARYTQVWQDGGANVLIKDDQSRRLGELSNGTFVNEIPGAKIYGFLRDKAPAGHRAARGNSSGLLYLLPTGINYSVFLDGAEIGNDTKQKVTTIGPGYYTEVEGLKLSNGTGQAEFSTPMNGSHEVSYYSKGNISPRLKAGINSKDGPAYEFQIIKNSTSNDSAASDEVTRMAIDSHSGKLKVKTDGRGGKRGGNGLYDLKAARLTKKGPEVFSHRNIALDLGAAMLVDYAGWEGEGHAMSIGIDENDDGNIDETIDEADEGGSYTDITSSDEDDAGDQNAGAGEESGSVAAEDEGTGSGSGSGSGSGGDTGADSGGNSGGDSGGDSGGE
ncbi:MAG TPA: hypothetical protein VN455_11430 [Methanotrichaceae archaeon]|nr:hypothetical protein [Methanotrichaceae archaeon]